jgi:Cu2+-containing amine oxidase
VVVVSVFVEGFAVINRCANCFTSTTKSILLCRNVSPRYKHTFPQEPGGKRFLVENGHVDYLGWSFNIGHSPIAGVKLYNVRYRGYVVCHVCLC